MAEDELEQEALFCIEGPDEDGCVWITGRTRVIRGLRTLAPAERWQRSFRSGSARSISTR